MKRFFALALSALMVMSLLAGCGGSKDTSGDSADSGDAATVGETRDDLVIAFTAEPTQLDPQYVTDTNSSVVVLNTHDPLVRRTANGDIVPALAESWEMNEAGDSITLHIRKGVKFQDGSELTAEDVAFTLNRSIATAQSELYTESFKEAFVEDDYTVRLDLLYPDVAVLALLTQGNNCIVSKKIVESVGEENYANNICGTGAYKLVEWQKGGKLILEANEDYWQGAPSIKHLEYRILGELTTAVVALETGDIDMINNIGALDAQSVQANEELGYQETTSTTTWYVGFNCQKAPLDDARVRRALGMAINKEDIILGAADGAGTPAANAMPAGTTGAPPEDEQPTIPYDPEGAVKLLEEAGYGPGELTITFAVRDTSKKIGSIIQEQWKAIGVNTNVAIMERSAMLDDMHSGNLEAYIVGDVALSMDASMQISCLDSATIPYTNSVFYSNPEYDALNKQQSAQVSDPEKRIEIVTQLLEMEAQDAPRVHLYHPVANVAYNKNLNVTVAPTMECYCVYDMSWN